MNLRMGSGKWSIVLLAFVVIYLQCLHSEQMTLGKNDATMMGIVNVLVRQAHIGMILHVQKRVIWAIDFINTL